MSDVTWIDVVIRLAVGAVLGAIIGIERETAGQDAGFRTHLMLALGAALFGVISVAGFDRFMTEDVASDVRVDPSRVASYVVAGVGFIGGGTILKHGGTVRGITTAASLWCAAAIGLSAGIGFWSGAAAATVIGLVALSALKPLSRWISMRHVKPRSVVVVLDEPSRSSDAVATAQGCSSEAIKSIHIGRRDDGGSEVVVEFWSAPSDGHDALLRARSTNAWATPCAP